MNTNGILKKHWFHIFLHFGLDSALFYLAFVLGIGMRFGMRRLISSGVSGRF